MVESKKNKHFFWRNWRQESDVLRFPDHYLSCWRQENIRGRYARVIEIYSLAVAGLLPSPKLRPPLPVHIEKTILRMFCMLCNHKSNTFHGSATRNQTTDERTDVWSRDFLIWRINSGLLVWAGPWNKRVWADYEQLLRPVFSLFRGQNFF